MGKKNIGATISLKDGGFKSGIQAAISSFDKFKKGSNGASSAVKTFGSQTNSAGSSLASMAKKLVGIAATYASLKKVVSFGQECIEAFGVSEAAVKRLETTMMNVKGTTMEQVEAIKAYTSELQNTTVVEDDVTKQGASQLATFQLQGSTIKTLLPSLQDLAVAQYGVSVSGDQMQQMANLMGKVMTGNVGSLSRYGVTMNATQQKILKTGTESQKAAMLVEVLGKNFGGLATAMADTPEGRVQQFKNVWGDMYEVIGKELYPIVTSFLTYVTQRLPSITKAFTTAASVVIGGFQTIEPFVTGVIDVIWEGFEVYVLPAIGRLGDAISPITSGFTEMGGSVDWLDIISAGFDYLAQGIDLVASATSAVIDNWNWLGPIVYGVVGAIGAYNTIVGIKNTLTTIAAATTGLETTALSGMTIAQLAGAAATGVMTAATTAFGAAMAFVTSPIFLIVLAIGALIAIGVLLYKNWDKVCSFMKTAWESVKAFFVTIGTAIGTFFSNLWSGIKNAAISVFNSFANIASTAWNGIVSVFSGVASWFGGIFSSAWNMVTNAFSNVVGFFQGIWNTIKTMFTNIGTSIADGISGAFKAVVNSVISFAGNLINGFINSINWAIDVINNIPGVSIGKLQTVNLPMLANGGNITRPGDVIVGERGPEMLHLPKGASVEPLDRKGGKTENKFYINIDARDKSPEEIANELVPKLKLALEVL